MAARIVELQLDGGTYLFRVPDLQDLVVLDGAIPLLDTPKGFDPEKELEALAADEKRSGLLLERIDALIANVSIEPKLVAGVEVTKANMEAHVRTVFSQEQRVALFGQLQGMARGGEAAELEIRPLSETARSSESSTDTPGDGAGGHPHISIAAAD